MASTPSWSAAKQHVALVHERLPHLDPEEVRFYSRRDLAYARTAELAEHASRVDALITDPGFADRSAAGGQLLNVAQTREGELRLRLAIHGADARAPGLERTRGTADVRMVGNSVDSHRFLIFDDGTVLAYLLTDLSTLNPADACDFAIETTNEDLLDEKRRDFSVAWVGARRLEPPA